MNKQSLIYISLFTAYCQLPIARSFAQAPAIEWQNTIGGSGSDVLFVSMATPDGGYILGGTSLSPISGDKTEGVIGGILSYNDYWIVKLDATGSIVWQNTIGGTNYDYFTTLDVTDDGGYIVGGYSRSPVSGDKTEAPVGGGTTYYDYWVLKLNASGSIVWQNTMGGTDDDRLQKVKQTSDGGYILIGHSESGVSPDKSDPNYGMDDYWVVKLNAVGGIVWENSFGGTSYEKLYDVIELPGDGYVLGGYSRSPVSGNKTEANIGLEDYWIIKIDLLGNIIWQNTIGGTDQDQMYAIEQTSDDGFLLGGNSSSDISGDKTETFYHGDSDQDAWFVKVDAMGNVIWDQTIGGTDIDEIGSVSATPDHGFVIAGSTYSPLSGDLDEEVLGNQDAWVMKLNEDGYIIWQQVLGGDDYEEAFFCESTSDGGYIISCKTSSGISGEITEGTSGSNDFWIVKLASDDCIPQPVYADEDEDGYGVNTSVFSACEEPAYHSFISGDINDLNDFISPSDTEICDGFDNDCNGAIDDGLAGCNPGPAIEWQNTIGGIDEDFIGVGNPTSDGGYIVGGYSSSNISGDKTENKIGPSTSDYWVLKVDASGNIIWQNTIGGSAGERLYDVQQTTDGGYILGGISYSDPSDDKSEISISSDIWIVKLNGAGNVEWENTIIGSSFDEFRSIQQTTDGGYIIGAYSQSAVGYDKTEPCFGGYDYWIIKLNASGNIVWQNTIGGSNDEMLNSVKQTPDGGYIIAGNSKSGISFDKTEINYGNDDFWVVKLNATGTIVWQNTIAGTSYDVMADVVIAPDGGYLVGGHSSSLVGIDKTAPNKGADDYWILKLDASGNILWQKTYGGSAVDYLASINTTSDNGYILGGYSQSGATGDKVERLFGQTDYWIIKIDETGNIIWQNSLGGRNYDELNSVAETGDGGFILSGQSKSDQFYDKSEDNIGKYDYWVIKLSGECVAVAETCNTLDDDCNGVIDDGVVETISISAAGVTTFCQGGSVLLTATYSGTTVQWKKNGNPIPGATSSTYSANKSGNYTCETSSACDTEISNSIAVTVNKNPAASISAAGATTFCAGGSVTLTEIAVAGSTYQWYKGASAIAGATTTSYVATTAGNYKCRVTKTATGCYKNSNVIAVTVPCRENETITNNSFIIYPNPNNGAFTITSAFSASLHTQRETTLEIYNALGQLIYSKDFDPGAEINETVELDHATPGVYFVKTETDGKQFIQKLIIQ